MDKLENYRKVLQDIILNYAQYKPSHGHLETIPVCDTARDEYLLLVVGWDKPGRVHDVTIHTRIRDGKVLIEWDGIEQGIVQDMIEAGIPEEDIKFVSYSDYVKENEQVKDVAVA
ncbi:MAG: XisI protein [Blastocatellia bacterium]|nr:XisI protein [Blastocatellia bacterium]